MNPELAPKRPQTRGSFIHLFSVSGEQIGRVMKSSVRLFSKHISSLFEEVSGLFVDLLNQFPPETTQDASAGKHITSAVEPLFCSH